MWSAEQIKKLINDVCFTVILHNGNLKDKGKLFLTNFRNYVKNRWVISTLTKSSEIKWTYESKILVVSFFVVFMTRFKVCKSKTSFSTLFTLTYEG